MLFLCKGTRGGSYDPRRDARERAADEHAFRIASNTGADLAVWVRKRNASVLDRLEKGERVSEVVWYLNGAEVARRKPKTGSDGSYDDFLLESRIERNGTYDVRARMRFSDAAGISTGAEDSDLLRFRVHSIETPGQREALADLGHNLLPARYATVEASSHHGSQKPELAIDTHGSTEWLCAESDEIPWYRIKLETPVRVRAIKLTHAHHGSGVSLYSSSSLINSTEIGRTFLLWTVLVSTSNMYRVYYYLSCHLHECLGGRGVYKPGF